MALEPGTRLGPYEIVAPIGAGGMGEVYRARDTRLHRDVAVKVLPASLAGDPDRIRRFEQEARAAGVLNHPNILSIFDIGNDGGTWYVVSELLEGETLRARLAGGALPQRKALDYALQCAHGMAAAYQKGIVHRDLKPENLFLTTDGRVKILDFGLAKLTEAMPEGAEGNTSAPTRALGTNPGVVMGTAGYMSPEQVRGQAVDHRTDIFAFGAVLYEMLTGRRAFEGASSVETMNAVLKDEPLDLAPLAPRLAPSLERIVRHCLEKQPGDRFQSVQDLAFGLESAGTDSSGPRAAVVGPAETGRRRWLVAVAACVACLAMGFAAAQFFRPGGLDISGLRFTPVATDAVYEGQPDWSPDGKTLAYTAEVDGIRQVFTRALDAPASAQITHTPSHCVAPFWSPDGSRIYFTSSGDTKTGAASVLQGLWMVAAAGGEAQLIAPDAAMGAISPDGQTLAYATVADGAVKVWVAASSGQGERQLRFTEKGLQARTRFSPDGRQIAVGLTVGADYREIWLMPAAGGAPRRVAAARSGTRGFDFLPLAWLPDNRHIVFAAAVPGNAGNHLLVTDTRTGAVLPLTLGTGEQTDPAVSADGRRLAYTSAENDSDLFEVPLDGSAPSPLLATARPEHCAAWVPGSDEFVYSKDRVGTDEIWLRNAVHGWERPLITPSLFPDLHAERVSEARVSPDGQRVAFTKFAGGRTSIWMVATAGGQPVQLAENGFVPMWSPDGKWISYIEGGGTNNVALKKIRAGGGSAPVLVRSGGTSFYRQQWSPSGEWITWQTKDGLSLVSSDGSRVMPLTKQPWDVAGFSQDGASVYGLHLAAGQRLWLKRVDLRTQKETSVADLGSGVTDVHGYSLRHDGRKFVTSLTRSRGDIWLIEGVEKLWK